jgi:hypothetical protein
MAIGATGKQGVQAQKNVIFYGFLSDNDSVRRLGLVIVEPRPGKRIH